MFYLVHAASSLQLVKSDGTIVALTVPTGATVGSTYRARSAVLGQHVVIVNAPSENLWLDTQNNQLRRLSMIPPLHAPDLAAGAATGLTGAYKAKVSFAVKDENGLLLSESPLSPESASVTLANTKLSYSNIPVSLSTDCNCRRIYRTAAGGTVFFHAYDLDDNTSTTLLEALADESLSRLPSDPDLGNPAATVPGERLTLIVAWRSRLWAVPARYDLRDHVIFTAADKFYAWPVDNDFPAYPVGEDLFGVTGFIPRRDALGVLKRNRVLKIVGSSEDDFEMIIVVEAQGCVAPESCVVIKDVGFWLGTDGVYTWSDSGIKSITQKNVDPWFTSDTYFNRSKFPDAIAGYNPITNSYELGLAAAGSSVIDRWVSYSLDKDEWLGIHRTAAFTPSARALLLSDANDLRPVIAGTDGYLYLQNQTGNQDVSGAGAASAIDATIRTKWHSQGAPDAEHYWGQLSMLSRIEASGALTITPYVGRLDVAAGTTLTHTLTTGRERLGRLGVGALCSLEFRQNTAGQRFLLYGYEIKPAFEVGVR
jgi:hypothetical protein